MYPCKVDSAKLTFFFDFPVFGALIRYLEDVKNIFKAVLRFDDHIGEWVACKTQGSIDRFNKLSESVWLAF
jgi:hypothetical protein